MKAFLTFLLAAASLGESFAAPASRPFEGETLRYSINWPSGLSLGEAQLSSSRSASDGSYHFSMTADATFPGVPLTAAAKSDANGQFCALSLEKSSSLGAKKTNERTTFNPQANTATRTTEKGGKSEFNISPCSKDALSFLYFARNELIQGRVPQAQKVYYGAAYQARLEFKGTNTVPVSGTNTEADHLLAHIKGPVTEIDVDIFFARDAVRTPVLIRIPLSIGTFSLELNR